MFFGSDVAVLIPLFSLAIPVVAIIGGITAGIVRGVMRQRAWELIQRERIAAIERGIDPAKLGPAEVPDAFNSYGMSTNPRTAVRRRREGYFVGGLVTLFVGIALSVFLNGVTGEEHVWMVGLIPASVGLALLIAAGVIRSHEDESAPPAVR